MKQYLKLFMAVLLIFLSSNLQSQKVGLVLSGGGAKGIAHIGVIKALEDNNIPINYITGTSMGAIIGGLYAAGYSPDEMIKLVKSDDFNNWVSGNLPEQYTFFYKQDKPDASWVRMNFSIDSVLRTNIPSNLISPIMMDFAFLEIFSGANVVADNNFDSLFVPFRCVASDIEDAKAVVLKKGDLGAAIRASMTFPFYFKPIKIDGKLMFDGGMFNNFPSDVMYNDFYPDIIIGSQVAEGKVEAKENDIVSQLTAMLIGKTNYSVICQNGVLIKPDIIKVSVTDFSHTSEFIENGYKATIKQISNIRAFVLDTISKESVNEKRKLFKSRFPKLEVASLVVSGINKKQLKYITKGMSKTPFVFDGNNKAIPKHYISLNNVKTNYFRIINEGKIESIYPQLKYNKNDAAFDLFLNVKRENTIIASLGGNITSEGSNNLFMQIQYNYWTQNSYTTKLNGYFGRYYSSALAELRMDFHSSIPYFVRTQFVFNKFNYYRTGNMFFDKENPSYLIDNDSYCRISLGLPASNRGILTYNTTFAINSNSYFQVNDYTIYDKLDNTLFKFIKTGIEYEFNNLNRISYPNAGAKINFNVEIGIGNEEFIAGTSLLRQNIKDYNKPHKWFNASFLFKNFFLNVNKFSTGFMFYIYYSSINIFGNYTATALNAMTFSPLDITKLKFSPQYRSNKFSAIGAINTFEVLKNLEVQLEIYAYTPLSKIVRVENALSAKYSNEIDFFPLISSTLVYFTPIGPISLNAGYISKEIKPWFLFFKIGYLIFNDRSK